MIKASIPGLQSLRFYRMELYTHENKYITAHQTQFTSILRGGEEALDFRKLRQQNKNKQETDVAHTGFLHLVSVLTSNFTSKKCGRKKKWVTFNMKDVSYVHRQHSPNITALQGGGQCTQGTLQDQKLMSYQMTIQIFGLSNHSVLV